MGRSGHLKWGRNTVFSIIIQKNNRCESNDNYLYAIVCDRFSPLEIQNGRCAQLTIITTDGSVVYIGSNDGFVYGVSMLSGEKTFSFNESHASSVASSNDGALQLVQITTLPFVYFTVDTKRFTRVPDAVTIGL